MTIEEIFAKTLEAYSSCNSYKDHGKIEVFGPFSGTIYFETTFLGPDKMLVKVLYGDKAEPIQTETFWINGTAAFFYSNGQKNCCERLPIEDIRLFGLLNVCDFFVPSMLLQQTLGTTEKQFPPKLSFERLESSQPNQFVAQLPKDAGSLTISLDEAFHLRVISRKQHVQKLFDKFEPSLAMIRTLPIKTHGLAEKFFLLFGESGVVKVPDVELRCTYEEMIFDCEIPESIFDFKAKER